MSEMRFRVSLVLKTCRTCKWIQGHSIPHWGYIRQLSPPLTSRTRPPSLGVKAKQVERPFNPFSSLEVKIHIKWLVRPHAQFLWKTIWKKSPLWGPYASTDGAGKTQRSYDKILRMVFTSDGVGVVIRSVELYDLEKTVFWFRLLYVY